MDRWNTSLSRFSKYPFRFLNLYSAGSSWVHDKKKEKRQFYSLFLFVIIVLSIFPIISAGRSSDGVIVTQSDFQALRAIKHELIDFKGILKSWNDSGVGACAGGWVGIKCVNGEVIAIQLPWKGLGGRISEKIGQLQALRKLSLHDNVIAGPVPTSLSFLPNLRGVYLFNNRLSGSIPPSIGRSPLLQTLDLSNNQLSGTISPSLANSTRLYRLNLSHNALSGSIPVSFTQSPSLTFLALEHNNLSGSIPDTWVVNESYQLQYLTLDHNLLSGKIPASISKLSMVEEINLSHNHINGTIPDELGSLSRLTLLDLSNNAIHGTIPASLFNLSALATLDLKSNLLDNQIPDTMDRLKNLSVLELRNNKFIGLIPSTIGNISGLTSLDLSHNNFTGEIPSSLVSLANLTSLDVSYNNLSGTVPSLLSRKFNSTSFVGNVELCGYSPSTPCASPPPQTLPSPVSGVVKPHRHRKLSTKDIILIASGALLVVLLLLCCMLLCCLIRKKANSRAKNGGKASGLATTTGRGAKSVPGTEVESGEAGGKLVHFDGPFVFAADDLLCATAEIMGKSTYGTAYKATLEDGNQVAVKRLREKITKGQKEFEAEVAELGKIRHPNILALRAYYLGPKGEKLLVYDYMPNGSLSSFLHARGPETTIDWPTRMRIAIGITKGICFLHTKENIIHGNLTSSNILLDEQNNPKIADVGLSRLMTTAGNTNVIATAGTLGYRAPELSKIKNASIKTDVYSLGVIILELLTGKSPSESTDGLDLPQWVASIVKEEWTNEVFDVELMRDAPTIGDELLNTLKLALHCVDPTPTARPEAPQVVQKLEEIKPEILETPEVKAKLKVSCAMALWKLAKGSLLNSRKITETKALLCLAKIIEKEKGELQINCLMAVMELAAVAESNAELRRVAFKPTSPAGKAVIDQLLRVINEETDPPLVIPAIKAIGSLARTFPAKDTRIVEHVVCKLGHRNTDVAVEACIALGKFACPDNFNCVEHSKAIVEFDGVPKLINLLRHDRGQLHELQLLCYLALHVGNSKALEQARALSILEGAARHVLAQHPDLRELFAKAIHHLTLYQIGGHMHRQA